MKKIYSLLFSLIVLISYTCAQTKIDKIDELVSKYAEYGKFNGSIFVAEKGEIIYKKGFGWANVEWSVPNQPDTKHRLASITKQFTAMLILQLASENKLKLDASVSMYLPDYPKQSGDVITVHHLLTHTSGIPNYTSFQDYRERMLDTYRPEEIVRIFADSVLDFTPGEKFQYSNSGYVLLGYIVERVTGQTYEEVLQNKIFTPLKMHNTGYDHSNTVVKNKSSGYEKMGTTFHHAAYIDMSVPYAAGGLYSTVEDMYLWDQALYTDKLLPKKYMDLLFQNHIPTWGQKYYGYGWELGKVAMGNSKEFIQTAGHSGGINGFNTLITRIPSDRTSIILLNNAGGSPLGELTVAITGILYDKTYNFPKKAIANSLLEVIEKDGLQAGLKHYEEIKNSPTYELNEYEMNSLGYHFLQSGSPKEAAAVFKMNVDAFPNSFNTYDSYGEALLALGDSVHSIENYLKSLKLNPGSVYGIKALKSLGINTDTLVKKVTVEELKLLEGDYLITNPPGEENKNWKIEFKEVNGELFGNDRGYQYRLVPVGKNQFINPDDGASLVFDTNDQNAITLMLFGKFKFRKVM